MALRNIYADPKTFLQMLLECAQFVEKARHEPTSSKGDVLDSLETRLSLLIGKLLSQPTSATFSVFVDTEEEAMPLCLKSAHA
jgi:hypothetical protein